MAFEPGTRLGPYEITAKIGAGGMGEVYRATDTRLGREVAIKTLPATLADDKDRLARFEREAKLLASLNHAHIASVYGLDEHDGTLYIAMELVEGATLEERLKAGALPVDDALRLGLQIAEALEAAHEKGVVHRDLKPANVMVTADGVVKVLDFGLAKAFSGNPNEASPAHSPALSMAMTQQGLVLGTAGYMSPEQASGQATDQRADVWAFGVVLYETLTGLPLFSGESVPHILADVLRAEPDWDRLPKNLHPRIRQLLERCLEKKPRSRYAGITDARADIAAAIQDPEGLQVATAAGAIAAPRSLASRLTSGAALVVAGVVVAAIVAWQLWPTPAPLPVVRSIHAVPDQVTLLFPQVRQIAIAPDGRQFVYNETAGIHRHRLDEFEDLVIPGATAATDGGTRVSPVFSPDSESIAFARPDSNGTNIALVRMSAIGGAVTPLYNNIGSSGNVPLGISWEPDGNLIYALQQGGIWRISENGGEPEQLLETAASELVTLPDLLPGGDWVLFSTADVVSGAPDWDTARIVAASLSTGARRVLRAGGSAARYVPTGHLVYVFGNTLYAVPFDIDTINMTGGPVPVVTGILRDGTTGIAQYDFSDNGTLIYWPGATVDSGSATLAIVARDGAADRFSMPGGIYADTRVSPDGRWAAYTVSYSDGQDIAVYEFGASAAPRRLTFGGQSRFPVWSADSSRVAFQSSSDGTASIYWQPAGVSGGAPEKLTTATADETHTPDSFSVDGHLAYTVSSGGESSIWTLNPTTKEAEPLIAGGGISLSHAAFSPDGKWIAYQSTELGGSDIFVQPYPLTGEKYQVPHAGATTNHHPAWAPDGTELFYFPGINWFESVDIVTEPAFSFGEAEALANNPLNAAPASHRQFDVMPDGSGFIGAVPGNSVDTSVEGGVYIVQNWFDELKRLAPTD
jgi:serine/threonine-protein kinase